MDISSMLESVGQSATAKRVFSEPIERDGATIVLAAAVGGGGGMGEAPEGTEGKTGGGGGYGFGAKPAGAFVIKGDKVRWMPAVDVNRIIMGGQVVAIFALIGLRALLGGRRRSRSVHSHWWKRGS